MPLPSPSSVLLRTQSDERLVVLARAGHERAFEAIVERYRGGLLRVARRYLPDARAEDALQQAFLAAWSALQRGDDVRDLGAWLHRIARNSALNQLRSTGYDYAELEESLRAADAPADELERRAAMRQTLTGLAALPERQREALLRIAVEGRSQDEVARELGVSSGAVRQLVHRARHTLRAAATAVVPMPVATWLASGAGAAAEAVGGAGATALLAKGAAVVLATGVAAAPVIVAAEPDRSGHPPARHAARAGWAGPYLPEPSLGDPHRVPKCRRWRTRGVRQLRARAFRPVALRPVGLGEVGPVDVAAQAGGAGAPPRRRGATRPAPARRASRAKTIRPARARRAATTRRATGAAAPPAMALPAPVPQGPVPPGPARARRAPARRARVPGRRRPRPRPPRRRPTTPGQARRARAQARRARARPAPTTPAHGSSGSGSSGSETSNSGSGSSSGPGHG